MMIDKHQTTTTKSSHCSNHFQHIDNRKMKEVFLGGAKGVNINLNDCVTNACISAYRVGHFMKRGWKWGTPMVLLTYCRSYVYVYKDQLQTWKRLRETFLYPCLQPPVQVTNLHSHYFHFHFLNLCVYKTYNNMVSTVSLVVNNLQRHLILVSSLFYMISVISKVKATSQMIEVHHLPSEKYPAALTCR